MSGEQTCPDCGTTLPADAPRGLYPRCLMRAALGRPSSGDPDATAAHAGGPGVLETLARTIGPVPRVLLRDTRRARRPGPSSAPTAGPSMRRSATESTLFLRCAGRLQESAAAYREGFSRLVPDSAESRSRLANLLNTSGVEPVAIEALREAIRLKPDDALARYNLGHALVGQRKFDEANASYREAVRLKPDYPEALCNLGHRSYRPWVTGSRTPTWPASATPTPWRSSPGPRARRGRPSGPMSTRPWTRRARNSPPTPSPLPD